MTTRQDDIAAIVANTRRLLAHLRVDQRDGHNVYGRIRDAMNGWPRGTDSRGPANSIADPVANAATNHDRAGADLTRLDDHIKRAAQHLNAVIQIADTYRIRHAGDHDASKAGIADVGCESCARLPGAHGAPRWEPIYRATITLASGHKPGLCTFCHNHARRHGALPPLPLLDAHHRGEHKRVRKDAA